MQVNQVASLTKSYGFRKFNQTTTTKTQPILAPSNQPTADTVSFKSSITNGINSSRKWIDYGNIFQEGVNLANMHLGRAKAELVKLMNSNLSGTNFAKSVFHCGNFTGANLTNANFEDAILDGSWFKDVITNQTNFRTSNLDGAIFKGDFGPWTSLEKANVMGVDFKDANLENVNLGGAIYDHFTEFPRGFDPKEEGMVLYKENNGNYSDTDFNRMKLRYLTFINSDFSSAILHRADLKGCTFESCNMKNSRISKAYAKKAEIVGSDLSDSNLRRINLDKAFLRNVDLRGADLSEAILTWDRAENVNLENAQYNRDTVFNPGFNPKEHGMIYSSYTYGYLD